MENRYGQLNMAHIKVNKTEISDLSRNSIHKTVEIKYKLSEKGQKKSVLSGGDGMRDQTLHAYVTPELLESSTIKHDGTVVWYFFSYQKPLRWRIRSATNDQSNKPELVLEEETVAVMFDEPQTVESIVAYYNGLQEALKIEAQRLDELRRQLEQTELPEQIMLWERSKKVVAKDIFSRGFNCSQAVLGVFCEQLGLERELAFKISTGFGGGLRQGEVCGAVTGAVMVIGLKHGHHIEGDTETKQKVYQLTQEFIDRFKEKHQSIICKDLLGYSVAVPKEYELIKEKQLFTTLCPQLIADAVEILQEID